MTWILIVIIVVIFIAAVSKSTQKTQKKYTSHPESIVKSENDRKQRIMNGEHDDMYFAYKNHHQGKSLDQIQQYIKEKREESCYYWEDNRLEYKVLMELSRKLESIQNLEIKTLIESDKVYHLNYLKLLEYYRMISHNPHIYKGFKINMLIDALEIASYNKFYPDLIQKTPSVALKWLSARENEGEYIADKLKEIAREIQQKESPEDTYKRERKNIQSNISKAKKAGNWIKIEELERSLIELENQNTKK